MRRGAQLKEFAEMKSVLVSLVAVGACVIFSPSVASAASNPSPSGTGPPNQTCQNFLVSPPFGLATPGNTANSPGSVFNEKGFGMNGTSSGGTGGIAYGGAPVPGGAGAPSQYDVACYQQTQKPQMP
jgi:hypothetical protein